MDEQDEFEGAAANLNKANIKNANTPVDVSDPASVAAKQAAGKAAGDAAKAALVALANLDRKSR